MRPASKKTMSASSATKLAWTPSITSRNAPLAAARTFPAWAVSAWSPCSAASAWRTATRARPFNATTAATGGKCSVLMIVARWKFSAAGHSPIPVCLFDRKAQNFQDEKCIFHFSTRRGELRSPAGKKRCLRANTVRPYRIYTYRKTGLRIETIISINSFPCVGRLSGLASASRRGFLVAGVSSLWIDCGLFCCICSQKGLCFDECLCSWYMLMAPHP